MTTVTTFDLPEYDDYRVETEVTKDGKTIAHQLYFFQGELITEALIYFDQDNENPLKWPYKFVFKDYKNKVKSTVTKE